MSKEAMTLALEALEYIHEGANNQGPHTGISWRCVSKKAAPVITALRQALANEALDKMAENARELGLDYEPAQQKPKRWAVFCQGCRKEWSVSYPHPGKSICADCDDKLAQYDASPQPAQQEPVAWLKVIETPGGWGKFVEAKPHEKGAKPVYTSPPAQRKPLTDEEIILIVADCASSHQHTDIHFARAIEAKLKEKNNG